MTTKTNDWARHDRSARFMRSSFSWDQEPTDAQLQDAASRVHVELRLGSDFRHSFSAQLLTLAISNIVLRLPFETAFAVPVDQKLAASVPPPYEGETIGEAASSLAHALGAKEHFVKYPEAGGVSLKITGHDESFVLEVAADGWRAYVAKKPLEGPREGNGIAIYGAAAVATSELVRGWARVVARLGAKPGPTFEWDSRPIEDTALNFWCPGTDESGPSIRGLEFPPIDWAGAGAVSQSALAVLAAIPGIQLTSRIFDPKGIDEPDLNRSIGSFVADIGSPKPHVLTSRFGHAFDLKGVSAPYPRGIPDTSPWIVCGADDVTVRAKCQASWPENLLIIATEGRLAQVSSHPPGSDHFCAGCFSTAIFPDGPTPTIGPTSVISGAVGSAALCKFALRSEVAPRTDILTLRLDSPFALREERPAPNPNCEICASRRGT